MSYFVIVTNILPFEVDWGVISSFLVGLFFGVCFAVLIYIYIVLRFLGKKAYIKRTKAEEVQEEEVIEFIKNAQEKFKDKNLLENTNQFTHMYNVASDMSLKIARRFYPKSKYPLLELSIDESLLLFVYISQRIDQILDKRGLRMFRRVTISQIVKLTNTKKAIDESTIMKLQEKLNVKDVSKVTFSVMNMFNPFYWTKKLIINKSFDIITKKICLIVISIIGEEFYTVYSKNVFKVESNIEELVEEIENDLSDEELQETIESGNKLSEKKEKANNDENITLFEEVLNKKEKKKKRIFKDDFFKGLMKKKIKK